MRSATPAPSTSASTCTRTTGGSHSWSTTTAAASGPTTRRCARAASGSRRWRSAPSGSAAGWRSGPRRARARRCGSRWRVAERIRVLLVDDHAVVREGLRTYLELHEDIAVVGEAADGEEAIRAAEELRPDVVLMDLKMPVLDGVGALRALRERLPRTRAIALTSFTDEETLLPALQAGAAGYLLKNVQPSELHRAILAAHAGEALLDPVVAARLLDAIARPPGAPAAAPDRLTPREREVLELLARGYANKRIARELGVAEKTVKTHVGHVLAKLGVSDRTQAALLAVREGLVGQGS